jgi:hypothetical protein
MFFHRGLFRFTQWLQQGWTKEDKNKQVRQTEVSCMPTSSLTAADIACGRAVRVGRKSKVQSQERKTFEKGKKGMKDKIVDRRKGNPPPPTPLDIDVSLPLPFFSLPLDFHSLTLPFLFFSFFVTPYSALESLLPFCASRSSRSLHLSPYILPSPPAPRFRLR